MNKQPLQSCLCLSWVVWFCCVLLFLALSRVACLVLSCLFASRLVVSCLVLFCLVLSCLLLSSPFLSCLGLSCLVLCCLVLSCLVSSCLILLLSCRVLSSLTSSCSHLCSSPLLSSRTVLITELVGVAFSFIRSSLFRPSATAKVLSCFTFFLISFSLVVLISYASPTNTLQAEQQRHPKSLSVFARIPFFA